MMKYLYIFDHFVPFPSSEYGGLWVVLAKDDNECYDLVVDHDQGWNESFYLKAMENIQKADKIAVLQDQESRIVESFTT